jgi:hypothetical protein
MQSDEKYGPNMGLKCLFVTRSNYTPFHAINYTCPPAAQAAMNPNCPSSLTSLLAACTVSLTPATQQEMKLWLTTATRSTDSGECVTDIKYITIFPRSLKNHSEDTDHFVYNTVPLFNL